jgi:hypothetical protein
VRVLFVLPVTTLIRLVTDHERFSVNLDLSAAPEIALLAIPAQAPQAGQLPAGQLPAGQLPAGQLPAGQPLPTLGGLARELTLLAGRPERWWGAVRYHSDSSGKINLEVSGVTAWVGVLVPGDAGLSCSCDLMMLIAGDAVEESGSVTTALRAGRVRVHGQGLVHQIRAASAGFAVTLHVSAE